jgi:hypothetical protein
MIDINMQVRAEDLGTAVHDVCEIAGAAARRLRDRWDPSEGTPVFTVAGTYTSRGWTEWTQGFQFGIPLLVFEVTGDEEMLAYGRDETVARMAPHLTHTGVHDHGFNNVSTYGTLLRLMTERRIPELAWEREFYSLALKASGAVQGARWTDLPDDLGYVCSFNGHHSLFADTIRSMRSLAVAYRLGHLLMGEQDRRISLLRRLLAHAETTARFNVYFGDGRDSFDVRGRVAHESIFNLDSGAYRCPSSQQGYSPFSTWTRGQAWILAGYPEELEFIETLGDNEIAAVGLPYYPDRQSMLDRFEQVSRAVADHVIEHTPTDGVPYWDTGAPGLASMGDYRARPADPYNAHEPVDSSAAAISAQGLLRLGAYLARKGDTGAAGRYTQAGLTIARTLFSEPYLSTDPAHEGVLLHSVYHRPNGWDYVAAGQQVPNGESSMWGDYHAVELAVCIHRLAAGERMQRFFDIGLTGPGQRLGGAAAPGPGGTGNGGDA